MPDADVIRLATFIRRSLRSVPHHAIRRCRHIRLHAYHRALCHRRSRGTLRTGAACDNDLTCTDEFRARGTLSSQNRVNRIRRLAADGGPRGSSTQRRIDFGSVDASVMLTCGRGPSQWQDGRQ